MPTERIAMRRVREMLRLKLEGGLSDREITFRTGVARSMLREMFARFERSGRNSTDLVRRNLAVSADLRTVTESLLHQAGIKSHVLVQTRT